ncbi:hypothetical protein CWM47_34415 [Spirosoma pollinicola]|uniref:Uncharacterized protein n=1 Tax=Spirosoma pollinicola TaxID=2057025 RepID=A0A2K8Z9E3_9BACT|nr:hypothetical protein CWM47_34415 [Spirosoma pollinicola]
MALEVYWQEGSSKKQIGILKVDRGLSNLIDKFNQTLGLSIDLYGTSRIYISQLDWLIVLAESVGYPTIELVRIRSILPEVGTKGGLILIGD